MTRRLIALLLCICMIGSMTVYATDDVAAPTDPTQATEPQVEESTEPEVEESSEPVVEESSEPVVEESTEPQTDPTEPTQVDVPAGPAVGDTIYIKSGSYVYKTASDNDGHKLILNYTVKIVDIINNEAGVPEWYEFEFTSLGIGELLLREYKYVKVEDTTTTDPDATEPSEPEETDPTEPEDDGGFNREYENFDGSSASGISAAITAPKGAFPEGTTVTVKDTTVEASQVKSVVSGTIKGIVAVDISFGGQQPSERVVVNLDIPESKVPEGANMVYVVHMAPGGAELCATYYLTSAPGESLAFATDGFSSYAAVFVNGKYSTQKMSEVLEGNSRYSIATFNVDLFDYDPVTVNNALNGVTSDGNGFHFTGYGITGMGSNSGINNSESDRAKQGILQSTLTDDGLPVVNYLKGDNAGVNTGKVLFSTDEYTSAKTNIYDDIPFEVIYDNQTGFYEYKSSANHAQLNEAGNKIELYADTLSTNNAYRATLDLTTHHGSNDFTNVSASASSYKATAKNGTTNAGDRLDPYVYFTVPKVPTADGTATEAVDASTVGLIYVKAKIPASVGKNKFQIFFQSDTKPAASEENTYIHEYTATGDWIEFIIDTADISNWNGKLSALRIDLFDANQAVGNALDETASYPIEIAQVSLIQKNYDAYATRGGFYPFSEIEDSYPGNNTYFTYDRWEKFIQDSGLAQDRASRSIYNPTPNPATALYDELAYGMVMEYDFYLPVDKTGEDLTYYFNGDDDLWVFVDGKLALDIGGGHGAITGKLNFSDGSMEVASAVTVTGYNTGADGTPEKVTGKMDESMWTAGKHTMKIFYLERGGSVSNCFMKFNLPQTPQGSVTVSKSVAEANSADTSILEKEQFEFTIEMQDKGAQEDDPYYSKEAWADKSFYIVNADGSTTEAKTTAEGKFYLTHSQEARFDIAENCEVTVTETKHDVPGYKYVSTTVNGTSGMSATQITEKDQETSFNFVNTYKDLYSDLTIIKKGISDLDNHSADGANKEEKQSTIYTISGTVSDTGETISMDVVIVGNGSVTIKDMPIGSYTVTEKTAWSWRYELKNAYAANDEDAKYEPAEKAITFDLTSAGETVTFENERVKSSWLSGDNWIQNLLSANGIAS